MINKQGHLSTGTLVSSLDQKKHSLIKDHISMSFSSFLKIQTLTDLCPLFSTSEHFKLSYFFHRRNIKNQDILDKFKSSVVILKANKIKC